MAAECVGAVRVVAGVIKTYFRQKHPAGKAAEHVAAEYIVSDRQARRWLKSGPPFPIFCQMLKRESEKFAEAVSKAFAKNADRPRPRRFRWRRAA